MGSWFQKWLDSLSPVAYWSVVLIAAVIVFLLVAQLWGCKPDVIEDFSEADTLEVAVEVSALRAQAETCLSNTVNVNSLVGSCNAVPVNLPELTLGQNYTSVTDLAQGVYPGFIYPDSNGMPIVHRAKGDSISNILRAAGAVKVACFGMSNSKLIFDNLISRLPGSSLDNPAVTIVDYAVSGADLAKWLTMSIAYDPAVKVALVYHSNNKPQTSACVSAKRFPTHAQTTQAQLEQFLTKMKAAFPNLKQVFINSREFGGWSCPPSGTKYLEPVAYEEGYAVKWFVEAHLGRVDPWIAWGPYTWSRNTPRSFFRNDGAHECSSTGVPHFGQVWFDWLLSDPTARIWFAQ